MQKQYCREYSQRQPGWEIVKEFSEKGISGFKVSAKDRDAIQEIQRDALAGKFDILLVFMFDCLGRRDDETPFVVEWFVKSGIEVWRAMEGQQRFDTHVDKLLNYIRYWQASGESVKISMRVKNRMEQLTQEGHYTCVICNGDCKSDLLPDLQIIDEDLFQRAQKIMEKRTTHHSDVPLNTRGQSLLVGNIFCGHC